MSPSYQARLEWPRCVNSAPASDCDKRPARGVTALIRAVSGEKQIYSGNLEISPGIGKPGKFFGKYKIFSGH